MASAERPFSEVLGNIFGNVEDIVRSEFKLAKVEVREEIAHTTRALGWLATGVLSVFFALSFLLAAVFFALLFVVPNWAAALIIAAALGIVGAIAFQVRAGKAQRELDPRRPSLSAAPHKETLA